VWTEYDDVDGEHKVVVYDMVDRLEIDRVAGRNAIWRP